MQKTKPGHGLFDVYSDEAIQPYIDRFGFTEDDLDYKPIQYLLKSKIDSDLYLAQLKHDVITAIGRLSAITIK
jgi:hypothetical protein